MENIDLHKLKKLLMDYNVIVSFNGIFSQNLIEELGLAIKNYLQLENKSKTEVHSVFAIFVEQTQNVKNYVSKYSDADNFIFNSGIVIIGKDANNFIVSSGNLIKNEDIPDLKNSLTELNTLDKDELRKRYKIIMKSDWDATAKENSKAGLGLIDMKRKSSKKFDFCFSEITKELSFFTLKVTI